MGAGRKPAIFWRIALFLRRKTAIIRKMITETEIAACILEGELQLPPLSIRALTARVRSGERKGADLAVEVAWEEQRYVFLVECKRTSTPKAFNEATDRLLGRRGQGEERWMLVAPYLSPTQLQELQEKKLSGVDLSGNGVVIVSGRLLVFRTGAPSKYRQSERIRNVFRGTSSVVARAFLLQPRYSSVTAVRDFIMNRGGEVAISTVSKVLNRLEEELIVGRSDGRVRVLQPDMLLDRLAANYRLPRIKRRFRGRTSMDRERIVGLIEHEAGIARGRFAFTGLSSVQQYGVMGREERNSVYVATLSARLLAKAQEVAEEGDRFWNLELLETDEKAVFFDLRQQGGGCPWASPVQTYLELVQGDKRDRETGEQVRDRILFDMRLAGEVSPQNA